MLKDYVSEAEQEMKLTYEAWIAIESEINRRRRDWSDADLKFSEILNELKSLNDQ